MDISTESTEFGLECDIDMGPPPEDNTHEQPPPPPPPPPPVTQSGRPRRVYRLPKRYQDILPTPPPPLPPPTVVPDPIRRVTLIVRDRLVTAADTFGVWRDYPARPSRDPDSSLAPEDLAEQNISSQLDASSNPAAADQPSHFRNPSAQCLVEWMNNGHMVKSAGQINELVERMRKARLNIDDLEGFDANRENERFDRSLRLSDLKNQFQETSVTISIPSGEREIPPQKFIVPGLLHRNLTEVLRKAFEHPLADMYHYSPFKLFHKSPLTGKDERIYQEIYNSDAFLKEHEEVQRHGELPPDDLDCKREKVVAALMFSSDATHLTNFGNAKAWPVYLMLGNLSKYVRARPNSGAMHHLAYLPSVCVLPFNCSHSCTYSLSSFLIPFLTLHPSFIASGNHKTVT